MCGIIAYIGAKQAVEVLLGGLRRMEYRGYDSAGVALSQPVESKEDDESKTAAAPIKVVKKVGKVINLTNACKGTDVTGTLGIGHTRWATHGAPSDRNSHPHSSMSGDVVVVHNGIIENFASLKVTLARKGYEFTSDTDTELIAHVISDVRRETPPDVPLVDIVRQSLTQLEGTFGLAIMFSDHPDLLIGARKGSPLILGVGKGEYLLASDASAIVEHTRNVVYLNDGELVAVTRSGYEVSPIVGKLKRLASVHTLEMTLGEIEKGGFKHFMLKEIMEQPTVLENAMRGRVNTATGDIKLGGLSDKMDELIAAKRFIICACGTSFHAGLVGEYLIESMARIPVEVEYASEFRYRDPILRSGEDVVIVISQSGETADTLAAVNKAKEEGVLAIGLVNAVGSTIARETDAGVYLHVGPEIGVASTKAFTGQVLVLAMMAIQLGRANGHIDEEQMARYVADLARIPDHIRTVLTQGETIFDLCRAFRFASGFLYLGRGFNFPVALEGALKLKEISYIHAEGYAAAEMKHGPIALIDKFMPVVVIAPYSDPRYLKIKSNIEEVLARGGCVIAVTEEGNDDLDAKCEAVFKVPRTSDFLSPLLTVVPLQLMSYYIADLRKCNVDQPRNLAKSVTVE